MRNGVKDTLDTPIYRSKIRNRGGPIGSGRLGSTSVFSASDGNGNGKSQAYINVLPMQDYQLEKWRQAYHSKEAALKHF